MKDRLLTPEAVAANPFDKSRGSTLSFGCRMWMPGVDISGNNYSVAYEDMTEEHRQGIPVRHNGRLIGHVSTDAKGNGSIQLLPGEVMPVLESTPQVSIGLVGMAPTCEAITLEPVIKTIEECINETRS